MAHVHCTATGYAASQGRKAYIDVLCDEECLLRALLAPCLHPFATASIFANMHSRETVAPVCSAVNMVDLMERCLCSRGR